jgi:hypothetical protein
MRIRQWIEDFPETLPPANLRDAFFDGTTYLKGTILGNKDYGYALLADVSWGSVNLAVVDWGAVQMLGGEYRTQQKMQDGKASDKTAQLRENEIAVRANRQLAVALQAQGLNEEASRFAYFGQVLQRKVYWRKHMYGKYLFSLFIDMLAGYGYKPMRSIIVYLLVIAGFAVGYYEMTHFLHAQPYPVAWYEALILSISSFHGRGFFQPVHSLGDPVAILAAIEAVFGLFIEISFIATFTQRFFGK